MTDKDLMIKMVVSTWKANVKRIDDFISGISEENFDKEVAPGRNTVGWIIGHLAWVNDELLGVYGINKTADAGMSATFKADQKDAANSYSPQQIKDYWKATVANIDEAIAAFTGDDWFSRHTRVSEEDFQKEPHRNKLNVLINRTVHLSYHLGQLVLVTP